MLAKQNTELPPGSVLDLQATAVTYNTATFTWTAPADDCYDPASGPAAEYRFYVRKGYDAATLNCGPFTVDVPLGPGDPCSLDYYSTLAPSSPGLTESFVHGYFAPSTQYRLEYDQGFFVKNGDGSAEVKPIAHLYKSQVYALARYLQLPDAICAAVPTTDTYSLEQGQDEFYFVLPYGAMDMVLCGLNLGKGIGDIARETALSEGQVERVIQDIRTKRKTTRPLHLKPILVGPVPEVAG